MAHTLADQSMPDFNSWISDLNLSSPSILEEKVDNICKGIEDRLNPKNELEYIKVMQSHLLLEVWSQIRIFMMEQYQKNEYFCNAQITKLNKNQNKQSPRRKNQKKDKAQTIHYSYNGSITIRSSKTHIQIPASSYLLLLWKNKYEQQPQLLLNEEIDDEAEAKTNNKKNTFPPHVLVQVDTPKMNKTNKYLTMWDIKLSLNERAYDLMKLNRNTYGNECNLNVVPIKNLIYLQRDYDAVKHVDKMPLSVYIMGKEHLIKRKCTKMDNLLDFIKNDGLIKKYYNKLLNKSQNHALKESLKAPLTLIHGPPGTGKTKYALLPILKCSYLALKIQCDLRNRQNVSNLMGRLKNMRNLVQQIGKIWKSPRIGIFAGSNQAIDEIILNILALNNSKCRVYSDIPVVRMGNTYNMDINVAKDPSLNLNNWIDYYLGFKWDKISKTEICGWKQKYNERVNTIQNELKEIETNLAQCVKQCKENLMTNHKLWEKIKKLFVRSRPLSLELSCLRKVDGGRYPNQVQRRILPVLMNSCQVLFSTSNYLGRCQVSKNSKTLTVDRFDFSIFDECCQMRETETLIALQHCSRAVLIGDPKQLQATILYHGKYRALLLNSLFIRIEKYIAPIMLSEQYRMNAQISLFPSKQFYDGKLLNATIIQKGERNASFHSDKRGIFSPYLFFDIIGVEEKRANSLINVSEIECITTLIDTFCKTDGYLKEIAHIGIITPYLAHKKLINAKLMQTRQYLLQQHRIKVECVTVDEFQGSERDIIIFSCVRSNHENNIGFLNDISRLNVAITRAKYSLWIIGNANCLKSADSTWNALVEDAIQRKLLISNFIK